jgi:predicted nucleic acid-binding protein
MQSSKKSELIVDNSIVMTWVFEDEFDAYANKVLDGLNDNIALVPPIWRLEVVNVLISAERRGRITQSASNRFLTLLNDLQFQVIEENMTQSMDTHLSIARDYHLSSYDAAYLNLAITRSLPIATLDKNLIKAAKQADVPLWQPL